MYSLETQARSQDSAEDGIQPCILSASSRDIVGSLSEGISDNKLTANTKLVQDLLLQLDACKSMGPNGNHPRVLKELDIIIVGPFSIIFQQFWESGEISVD